MRSPDMLSHHAIDPSEEVTKPAHGIACHGGYDHDFHIYGYHYNISSHLTIDNCFLLRIDAVFL